MRRTSLPLFAGLSVAIHGATLLMATSRPGTATAAPAFDTNPAPLSGETLDVEPPVDRADEDPADESPTSSPAATPAAAHPPSAGPGPRSATAIAASAPAAASKPAVFGAVGIRYATDLATTFTRGFPQAASADGIWQSANLGTSGAAEVTMVIDETGRLTSSQVTGSPSPALRRGIDRTLVLLGPRTFTSRGAVTHLRITARVSRDDVHDGLHGDVYALSGGSFTGDVGSAFFTLPSPTGSGRRIDVELRLIP